MKRILMCFIIVLLLTGCNTNIGKKDDNSTIKKAGMEFYVPENFLQNKNKVKEINDSLSFSLTYEKNTLNEYCCVNMDSFLIYLVIIPEENYDSIEGLEELFYNHGMRLTMKEDNAVVGIDQKDKKKIIVEEVYCEALLDQEFYADFTGKATLIQDTYRNIVLFAGAQGREIELTKKQDALIGDIIGSLTTTVTKQQQIDERVKVTKDLKQNEQANISIISRNGILDQAELQSINVLNEEEFLKTEEEYKELPNAPHGYEWCFVTIKGEQLARINVKIKNSDGKLYKTGSRTYTITLSEENRVDAFLIPSNSNAYVLEFGEEGHKSVLEVKN